VIVNVVLLVRTGDQGVIDQKVDHPPLGAAYVPSALRKLVVPPPVVSVTPLTTCPAGSVTVPVNVGEARLALSPIAVA